MKRHLKKLAVLFIVLAVAVPAAAATIEYITAGTVPSSVGQPLCSTATSPPRATFEDPSTCGLPSLSAHINSLTYTGSSTSDPTRFGWPASSVSGNSARIQIDGDSSAIQSSWGDKVQLFAFHGVEVDGARGAIGSPSFVTGSGSSDYSLAVVGGGGGLGLTVSGLTNLTGSLDVSGTANVVPHGALVTPTLTNSWVNFGGGFQTAHYYKDPAGIVHLEGLIKSGTIGAAAFTLSSGFLPTANVAFPASSNSTIGQVEITTAGLVEPILPSSNASVWLDGITFRTN